MQMLSAGKGEIVAVGFAPGRSTLVAAHDVAGMFAWDLGTAKPPLKIWPQRYYYPRTLTFSPDGQYLLHRGTRDLVAIDLATGEQHELEPRGGDSIGDFQLSADGARLLVAYGSYWAPKKLTLFRQWKDDWAEGWSFERTEGIIGGVSISPDAGYIAHLCRHVSLRWPYSYRLALRDGNTGEELTQGEYPYSYRSQLLFRPDGTQLIAIHEMTLVVWSVPNMGKPMLLRNDSRRHFTSAAFHPSGRYLFTTSNDATVLVWDTATWQHVNRFTWNIGRLRSVAVSSDGTLAVAGSDKGQIVIWDVDL